MKILLVVVSSLLIIGYRDDKAQIGGVRTDIEEASDSSFASQDRGPKERSSVDEEKAFSYLHEVLLNKEFGAGSGSVIRWIESPDVALVEGSEKSRAVLNRVIEQLNNALEGTPMRLESVTDRSFHGAGIAVPGHWSDTWFQSIRKTGWLCVGLLGYPEEFHSKSHRHGCC